MSDITKAFMALERSGKMETTVCIRHKSAVDWSWVMIRYPSDLYDERPTEIIQDFKGKKWPEILEYVKAYLNAHPEDGFSFT